ncbi:MAG: tetratricopeptide repeat protein [bacterium]
MATCPECRKPIPEGHNECLSCAEESMNLSTSVTAHINLLKKKIEKEPLNAQYHMALADIYQQYGYLKQALSEYEKAANADVKNIDAQIKSAHLYLKFRKLSQAENAFRAALHINPKSTESLIGLFRSLYLQDRTEEAIVLCEKIVKSRPSNVEFHILLKNLYNNKGDKEKALSELLILESLSPESEQFVKEIAFYYQKENNMEKAKEYYNKMSNMNIRDIELGFQIGKYYYDSKQYSNAFEHFRDLLELSELTLEQDATVRTYIALISFEKGDIPEAKSSINAIQQSSAQSMDVETQKKLASLCFKIGQDELKNKKENKAIPFLNKAVNYDRDNVEYRQILEQTKNSAAISSKKLMKKLAVIAMGVASAFIIIELAWILTHNKIIISIDPAEEAAIVIDGNPVKTPERKSGTISSPTLFMGKHDIIIETKGYEKWQGSANVGFGRSTRLEVTLIPIFYFLQITSVPEKAAVIIDGQPAGKTPYTTDRIVTRPHIIELEYPGHLRWRTELIVNEKDSIDMGVIKLKNLAGKWYGKIGDNSYAYNADFNMTMQQVDTFLTIKFYHRPREDNSYSGKINGKIKNGEFRAEGNVAYKYKDVFYWKQTKKKIAIQGTISEDWDRLEGKYRIESLAEQSWWASR